MDVPTDLKRRATIPPSPPEQDEEDCKKIKREESVSNVFQKWLDRGNDRKCKLCDSDICHSDLYFEWITFKYNNHETLYHVPRH